MPLNRFTPAHMVSIKHELLDSTSGAWKPVDTDESESESLDDSSSVHKENEEFTEISLKEPAQQEGKLSLKKDKTVTLKQIGDGLKEAFQNTILYRTVNLICGLFKVMLTNAKMSETFDTRPYTASDIIHGRRAPTTVATVYTCFHHLKNVFAKEEENEDIVNRTPLFDQRLGEEMRLPDALKENTPEEGSVITDRADKIREKENQGSGAPHDLSPISRTRSFRNFADIDLD